MYEVGYHPEAEAEYEQLPRRERIAVAKVVEKLEILGAALPFPHQSRVEGAEDLRELRPRAGRSAWRPLYRQIARERFVIAAIAPEGGDDPRRFRRAVRKAERRLDEIK